MGLTLYIIYQKYQANNAKTKVHPQKLRITSQYIKQSHSAHEMKSEH